MKRTLNLNFKGLSARIKYALGTTDKSQTELAEEIGVTRASVSNWILGRCKKMEAIHAIKVAKALNVDVHWLITGEGTPEKKYGDEIPEISKWFTSIYEKLNPDRQELLKSIIEVFEFNEFL